YIPQYIRSSNPKLIVLHAAIRRVRERSAEDCRLKMELERIPRFQLPAPIPLYNQSDQSREALHLQLQSRYSRAPLRLRGPRTEDFLSANGRFQQFSGQ